MKQLNLNFGTKYHYFMNIEDDDMIYRIDESGDNLVFCCSNHWMKSSHSLNLKQAIEFFDLELTEEEAKKH